VKGATYKVVYRKVCSSFNPRAREGRDGFFFYSIAERQVSIHAPVKGATNTTEFGCVMTDVSIHAPVKGATVWIGLLMRSRTQFQSTRP